MKTRMVYRVFVESSSEILAYAFVHSFAVKKDAECAAARLNDLFEITGSDLNATVKAFREEV